MSVEPPWIPRWAGWLILVSARVKWVMLAWAAALAAALALHWLLP